MTETEPAAGDPSAPERGNPPPSLRSGLSYSALSFASAVVLGLASALVTSRIYGVEVLGEFAIASTPWLIVIRVSHLQEQVAFSRALAVMRPGSRQVGGVFLAVLTFSFGLTLVASAVVLAIATVVLRGPAASPDLLLPAVVLLGGYVLVDNTSWNIDTVLSSFGAGRAIFLVRTTQLLALIAAAVGFATVEKTVWGLVAATLVSFVAGLTIRLLLVRSYAPLLPGRVALLEGFRRLPALVRYGAVLFPGSVASGLADQSTVWILGATSSITVVGAWSRASGLASRMVEASWRIGEILFPALVRRRHEGDHTGFADATAKATRYAAIALFLAAAVGGGLAGPVLRVFGPGFDRADDALAILLVAYGIDTVASVQGWALLAALPPRTLTMISVTRGVSAIALMVPGAVVGGAEGVASAILVSYLGSAVWSASLLRRRVLGPADQRFGAGDALRVLMAFGAGFGVARGAVVVLPDLAAVIVGTALAVMVFVLVALGTSLVRRDDLEFAAETLGARFTAIRRWA